MQSIGSPTSIAVSNRNAQRLIQDNGRRIGYAEYGHGAARPVFYFHGLPGSRLEAGLLDSAARDLGVRLIALDRPGVGLSDPSPGTGLLPWTDDVVALADALSIERFIILGVSAGAPYALACAYRFATRILAIGIVGGLGPCHQAWARTGLRRHGRLAFWMARNAPWLLRPTFGFATATAMTRFPRLTYRIVAAAARAPDRAVLARPEVKATLLVSLRAAMCQGATGALQELCHFAQAWGFELGEIRVPVKFWHGELDHVVPLSHTHYHEAKLPLATAVYVPGEGHFSLPIKHGKEILRSLVTETA